MQCSNHLKQIGLAMHNFHDTKGGIVPLTIGSGSNHDTNNNNWARVTYFVLLYPFTEQTNLYDVFASNTWGGSIGTGSNGITGDVGQIKGANAPAWWDKAKAQFPSFPDMIASVGTYRCPSRRGASQSYHDESTTTDFPGPLGDYATPILFSGSYYWHNCYRPWAEALNPDNDYKYSWHAIRLAVHPRDDPRQFIPRDDFAYLMDGTSNTLVLGEKHIPQNRLGVSKNGGAPGVDTSFTADASYIVGAGWGMAGCARNILSRAPTLASPGDTEYEADGQQAINGTTIKTTDTTTFDGIFNPKDNSLNGSYDFGSSHPGVCNFLIGDGSVRAVPTSTPKVFLARLVHVSDGLSATLP